VRLTEAVTASNPVLYPRTRLPVWDVTEVGLNVTVLLQLAPTAKVLPQVLVCVNCPVPVILTAKSLAERPPVLVHPTVYDPVEPETTLPKPYELKLGVTLPALEATTGDHSTPSA
jgi:hypothetical protein